MEGYGYRDRVADEKKELQTKILHLQQFIKGESHSDSPAYSKLEDDEQDLLERQLAVMMQYAQILDERIELWADESDKE